MFVVSSWPTPLSPGPTNPLPRRADANNIRYTYMATHNIYMWFIRTHTYPCIYRAINYLLNRTRGAHQMTRENPPQRLLFKPQLLLYVGNNIL